MYNTGFIPEDAYKARIRQGLVPQDITNACAYVEPSMTKQGVYAGASCNCANLYPAPSVRMRYNVPFCKCGSCTEYIQAP